MTPIKQIALAALMACAAPASVSAATLTFSQGVSIPTAPDWYADLSLRQFDPTLGTLTNVSVTLFGSIDGYAYFENLEPYAIDRFVYDEGLFVLQGLPAISAIPFISSGAEWASPVLTQAPFDGVADFSGPDTIYWSGHGVGQLTAAASDISGYIGSGFLPATLTVTANLREGYSYRSDLNVFAHDVITAGASVTYTYDLPVTPPPPVGGVPEPAGWALMMVGIGLSGAALRRRAASLAGSAQPPHVRAGSNPG